MKTRAAALLALALSGIGCGSTEHDNGARGDAGSEFAAQWQTLISGEWTLPEGTEGYKCVRQTVNEDLFVAGFDAIIPKGTHHTLLTMGPPNGPDGMSACRAGSNFSLSVFGSGVGTDPIEFPKGVAFKIPKGVQLLLNLHLFNTGRGDLSGTSGTRIHTIAESEVVAQAEGLLAGTIKLDIPPGKTTTHTGFCTMSHDATLIAVAPHMHQLGIYEKVIAQTSRLGDVTLFDGPYNFNEQSYQFIPPLQVAQGDRVRVECTHRNTTDKPVTFGESTLAEMCFAGIYRYPAGGGFFICSDDLAGFPFGPDAGGFSWTDAGGSSPTDASPLPTDANDR
jgi:hypothetical protein